MSFQHQQLASGRWAEMPFFQQMANIGSEVQRAILWQEKKNLKYSEMALERALELLDLTIADSKNVKRLKELARLREMLVDHFRFNNDYHSTNQNWSKYFYAFNYASQLGK